MTIFMIETLNTTKTYSPMFDTFNIQKIPLHAVNMLESIIETIPFIRKNKLWKGFFENKWVATVSIIVSVLFSYWLMSDMFSTNDIDLSGIDAADLSEQGESIKKNIKEASQGEAISSGTRYLLLILLEVIIFHFSVKTLSILTTNTAYPKFKEFIAAEKRMIRLLIISFFKGLLASIILGIVLSIVGLNDLTSFMMFFVYSYFMGYAFIDNYNEQFDINIKDSLLKVRQHVGAATILGVVVTALMYFPIIGPFFAPLFGAVAGTLYSHKYQVQKVIL